MSTVQYVLADPTGNITALVESPVEKNRRKAVADAIMAAHPTVEQVGFLCPPRDGEVVKLQMTGGEFCGNAALSAAAWHCRQTGAPGGRFSVRVSGAAAAVPVAVQAHGERFGGEVAMPLPQAVETATLPLNGRNEAAPLVRFEGITHAIWTKPLESAAAEQAVKVWCARQNAAAMGLMCLHGAVLRPLVYVAAADTLFWETSCASGTAAVGAWLTVSGQRGVRLTLQEPGGALSVRTVWQNRLTALTLCGGVRLSPPYTLSV